MGAAAGPSATEGSSARGAPDWRAHIQKAFEGRTAPTFSSPESNPWRTLSEVCPQPPASLVSFLKATDGVHDNDDIYQVFLGAKDIVRNTRDARGRTRLLRTFVVIGGPGVDGILFVMKEGTDSDRVQIYYPIGDELRDEPGQRLWDFVESWGERSAEF